MRQPSQESSNGFNILPTYRNLTLKTTLNKYALNKPLLQSLPFKEQMPMVIRFQSFLLQKGGKHAKESHFH